MHQNGEGGGDAGRARFCVCRRQRQVQARGAHWSFAGLGPPPCCALYPGPMPSSSWAADVVARFPDRQRLLGDLRKRLHRRVLSLMATRTGPVVLVVAASIGVVAAVHVLLLVGQCAMGSDMGGVYRG